VAVINPAFTVAITPRRPTEDFGEETFADQPAIRAVISLSPPAHRSIGGGGGESSRFFVYGQAFVPRGSDLRSNDTFRYRGHDFRVVGWATKDQQHPFTGEDFGWVSYLIEAVG
jgi:hypothetical protein